MQEKDADFGYSMMLMHTPNGDQVIGTDPPTYGGISTSTLIAKTSVCREINWGEESACGDWDLVSKWMAAGKSWACSDVISVEAFPASLGVIA